MSRTDRLAQLGTLTASVAHEINNPAAYVLTNLGLMLELLSELEAELEALPVDASRALHPVREMKEMCRDNRTGISRIAKIVRELRNHARAERSSNTTFQVNDAVSTAITMVQNQVRHDAELTVDLGEVPMAQGDEGEVVQVAMNLILNAAQAIRAQRQHRGCIHVATRCDGGRVSIVVRDDGGGMSDEVYARIFEPFFTTKASDEGTGLGLAICADIVAGAGGQILCDTTEGEGTTFEVLLLAAEAAPEMVASDVVPPPSSRPSRILVIDDDLPVARSLKRALDPPHRVVVAHGGIAGIERLRRDPRFDVVICDIMMPEADGPTVYRAACDIAPALGPRFIFVTGGAFSPVTREFLGTTRNEVCHKPLALDALRARIDEKLLALRSCSAA